MQISAPTAVPLPQALSTPLPGAGTSPDTPGRLPAPAGDAARPAPPPQPEGPPAAAADDRVTLSDAAPAAATAEAYGTPPPVFAEIWREGIKVAVIDNHGGVSSVSGLVLAMPGTAGGGGTALAVQRAIQVAQSIGGEIRVGGLAIDRQTLDMRTKLRTAYGV